MSTFEIFENFVDKNFFSTKLILLIIYMNLVVVYLVFVSFDLFKICLLIST